MTLFEQIPSLALAFNGADTATELLGGPFEAAVDIAAIGEFNKMVVVCGDGP